MGVTDSRLRPRSAPTKSATYVGRGGAEHGRRGVELLDAALPVDGDPVAEPDGLLDVVGDEQDRLAHGLLEAQELVLQVFAHDRVDRAERLVHQQHGRIRGQRACHTDALTLAAGELVGVAVAVKRRVEADEVEEFGGALAGLGALHAEEVRDGRRVVEDRLVREEADLLDHIADAAAELDRVDGRICRRRRGVSGPRVGSMSRFTIFIVVVLPQPDGPTSVTSSPSATSKDRSSTAVVPSAYRLVTCSNRIMGPHCAGQSPPVGAAV